MSISDILLYSSTISATDSVAALTMINAEDYPKLFSIIFGEGMVIHKFIFKNNKFYIHLHYY